MIVPSTWKGRTAGTVVSLDTDTLVVATRSKGSRYVDRIPLNAVTKLEVRRAQASHGENALEGAGVGLLAGGLIGLGLGSIIDINSGGYDLLTREETMLFFGTVLGLSGSLLGAAMGATDERWEPVRLPLSVSFSPHGGARVTLRFEFGR
jgi:hypothetical protein